MSCFGRSFPQEVTNLILGMRDSEAEYKKRLARDRFLMDFENSCLDSWVDEIPQGPTRVDDPEWSEHVRAAIEDYSISFKIYEAWVRAGHGDEWFFEGHSTYYSSTIN